MKTSQYERKERRFRKQATREAVYQDIRKRAQAAREELEAKLHERNREIRELKEKLEKRDATIKGLQEQLVELQEQR